LEALSPQNERKAKGKLYYELAPLIEKEDVSRAIEYYEKASRIFGDEEFPQEYFQIQLTLARLQTESLDFTSIDKFIAQAIMIGQELDIPPDFTPDKLPLSWTYLQEAVETAIDIGAQQYHNQKERVIIDKIVDWSNLRKVTRLLPFLAENIGFNQCKELLKLHQEETSLIAMASDFRKQLMTLSPKGSPPEEYQKQRTSLRTDLREIMEKINVNRNVIAAACQDPGRHLIPQDYKMLQKLAALMPIDRRWILINYDVLLKKQRIIITTLDHVGRHNLHTLPISPDLPSVIEKLQTITVAKQLPRMADLKDIASFLYRSLIPSRLERDLQNNNYGFLQFITDGFLSNVPFELIFDGKEYWGTKYPMAWTPDLQFFESTLKIKALAESGSSSVILGVNFDPERQSARKTHAEEITKTFLGAVPTRSGITEPIVLFGRDFNRALLSSNLDQPRSLLFLSTPASIHYRKGEITLQPPDSLRTIEIGVSFSFKGAPILVLSESSRIEPRADGYSLAGFLRHLVAAGSPSIVFSRWHPVTQFQSAFAQTLLKQLYEGDPIAVALLHTRRKLASKGPSPHSWLSYSLCGNPFPTLF
ncbi:MAG: CHAT domain-containing protein, partial [Candidatus Thorarchaeota archaeon]